MVTNTPGVLTDTTADLAWTLLMAIARRISEAERFLRSGQFKGWGIMILLGGDVHGKTLGLVGFTMKRDGRLAAGMAMAVALEALVWLVGLGDGAWVLAPLAAVPLVALAFELRDQAPVEPAPEAPARKIVRLLVGLVAGNTSDAFSEV